MVADVSSTTSTTNPKVLSRVTTLVKPKLVPLLPSEADNNGPPLPRPLKSRDVTSRYLSSGDSSPNNSDSTMSSCSSTTTSSFTNSICNPKRRFPLPLVSQTNVVTPASAVNTRRDQSVERCHSGKSHSGNMSASAKMLTKTSIRSLSVSFQGESFVLPVNKVAKPVNNGLINGTPERRKAAAMPAGISENSQPIDKQRWPGRSRQGSFMSMSVDFTNEKMKLSGSGSARVIRDLGKAINTDTKNMHNKLEIPEIDKTVNKLVFDSGNSDHVSNTESFSSGSTPGNVRGGGPRAIVVPARFWQETINLLRRVQPESVSLSPPLSKSNNLISGKILNDGRKLSPRGSSFSPVRGGIRQPSPSKRVIPSYLSKGMPCPSPIRSGVDSKKNLGNTPSILSFSADSRKGRVGENKLVDVHVLRLLHNKYLQWRFANAKVAAAMLVQRAIAQKSLYNAFVTISKMWISVLSKRVEVQQLKQNLKLLSVLKKQMSYLDNWDLADRDHSVSVAGIILALESSSLRLPVLCGAKADVQNLNEAICAAFDVMQTMEVSLCSLVTKAEHVNSMASELANAMKSECSLLDQCMDLLSTLTLLKVQDCSLRTHTLQLCSRCYDRTAKMKSLFTTYQKINY